MNKTKSLSIKWIQKQKTNSFIITPKIDGTSALIVIELKSGKMIKSIYTRGDGDYGKQLDFLNEILITTRQNKTILNYMNASSITKIVLRGEMIVSKESFESFKHLFKCPRSMVNGYK